MTKDKDGVDELNPDGGLTTLVDFRVGGTTGDSSLTNFAAVLRDENELRLERMMSREHLVYGVPTPFVGQRAALETLYNAVRDSVNQKTMRTVGVTGKAGMGKTRLVAELFGIIDPIQRGLRVVTASCSESESPEGISVFGQMIRSRAEIKSSDKPSDALGKIAEMVGASMREGVVETISRMLAILANVHADDGGLLESDEDLARLEWRAIEAFRDFLREDGLADSMIIVVYRAQFLTKRTIEVMEEVLTDLADVPITMIFLQDRPTTPQIVRASECHDEVNLLSLGDDAVERMVRAILVNVHELPDTLVRHIIDRSAGNPGLVEDNIRLLIQRGAIIRHERTWTLNPSMIGSVAKLPESRAAATLARISSLSPQIREVLELGCIFGPAFWMGGTLALARCCSTGNEGWTIPWVSDQTSAEIKGVLEEARSLELVVLHEGSAIDDDTEYSFVSRDVRNTLYDGIPEDRKMLYHRMVAQWLGGLDLKEGRHWYEVVANHLELGGRAERAAQAYLEAGLVMLQVNDWTRATDFFQRGLSLVDLSRADVLIPVLEGLGDARYASGDFVKARHFYGAMLEASLVPPSRRDGAQAWRKLGRTHRSLGVYPKALACFEHALKLFRETEANSGIADTLHDMATLKWLQGEPGGYDEALSYYRESLALRRESAEPMEVAESLTCIGNVLLQQGDVEIAEERYEEALEIQRKVGSRAAQISSYVGLGMIAYAKKDLAGAIQTWQLGLAIAEEVGSKQRMGVLLNNIGEIYLEQGDLELADGVLNRAREIASETGDKRTNAEICRNLAILALEGSQFDEANVFADEAVETCRLISARPALALALRTKAQLLSHQLYVDESGPSAATIEAGKCYEEAIRIFEEIGDRLELARTLRSHASHLQERGAEDRANELRARANKLEG